MFKRMGPDDKPRNFIGVSSIDQSLEKVTSLGGKIVGPKMKIPGIGWAAFATDSEGNLQGIYQDDPHVQ